MLSGLAGVLSRRRLALVVVAPVLAAPLGLALVLPGGGSPAASSTSVAVSARLAAHAERLLLARQIAVGNTSSFMRGLPHDEKATIGTPRFRQLPPSLKGGHVTGGIIGAGGAAVPTIAVQAYQHASSVLAMTTPACHINWAEIAGIGRVESDNGLTWGSAARVMSNGTVSPSIFGPILDGQHGFAAIPTTDGGYLEQEKKWARAVGPMQFLPSTWLQYARDGNGDNIRDPQNFWDAALTTGTFLCANGGNLSNAGGLGAAILAYNHSDSYLHLVLAWVKFYEAAGVSQLTAASSGLLPVGVSTLHPGSGSGSGSGSSSGSGRRQAPKSPATPPYLQMQRAAAATDSRGTYSFSFSLASGSTSLASGSAAVDVRAQRAGLSLSIPGSGTVLERVLPGGTDVSFGATLAAQLKVRTDEWFALTPRLQADLGGSVASLLLFAAGDARATVAQFGGASSAVSVAGHRTIVGVSTTQLSGPISFGVAGQRAPYAAAGLAEVARLIGASVLEATSWVDGFGTVRAAALTLPHLSGVSSDAVSAGFVLSGFGAPVTIATPGLSQYPPPPPPSTTTTTTTIPPTTTTSTTSPAPSTTSGAGGTTTTSS